MDVDQHFSPRHYGMYTIELNTEMDVSHPTLWSFISSRRKIQSGRDTYYLQLEAGRSPPKKLKKYLDVDKRLIKIWPHVETATAKWFYGEVATAICPRSFRTWVTRIDDFALTLNIIHELFMNYRYEKRVNYVMVDTKKNTRIIVKSIHSSLHRGRRGKFVREAKPYDKIIKPSIRFCPKTNTILPRLWGKICLEVFHTGRKISKRSKQKANNRNRNK
ncbi:hypothetical protein AGLY_000902 [Aphis glycines]|uniref:Uncharacterized protein n=1 Tax=Aphis glycines TaxID=307491 RepID=A0A6G0U9T7_APHGL|nr:hypothetical protein AGLY_000902 [Aphis glycines]